MDIKLSPAAKFCLNRLNDCGFEAYVVGGYVRDCLLSRVAYDVDITTSALPQQVVTCFGDLKTIQTNQQHGTITVLVEHDERHAVEITTYRIDGDYSDNRHPDSVQFTVNLADDLRRRDFTVNAFAYNEQDGLVDLFDGMKHLRDGVISVIGDGCQRFHEDALRIVRAFRFSAQLGFTIDDKTMQAIIETAELLKNISRERRTAELIKLVVCDDALEVLRMMEHVGVLSHVMPYRLPDGLPQCKLFESRMAAIVGVQPVEWLSELRLSNNHINAISKIVENRNVHLGDRIAVKRLMNKVGSDITRMILQHNDMDTQVVEDILCKNECYTLSQLEVNGRDLQRMGYTGKSIGFELNRLLDCSIVDNRLNEYEILVKMVEKGI